MTRLDPPTVVVIADIAALAGSAAFVPYIPNSDPEEKAPSMRRLEPAEQEAAARGKIAERSKDFFNANSDDFPRSEGQQITPRRGANRGSE